MKKNLITLLVLAGLVPLIQAQNLLKFEWKFSTGDDPAWASTGYDDSDWMKIQAGTPWEDQGFGEYDGYAWYRQTVVVPATLKKDAVKNGGFILCVGKIDDVDVTYWNGEFLGQTGKLPPNYETGYGDQRAYEISVDKIKWGEENTVAVRVYDGGGGGGIYADPVGLSVIGLKELVVIKPVMEREDHIVLEEGPVKINLLVENNMDRSLKGAIEINAISDFGEEILEESQEVKVKSGSSKNLAIELGNLDPGFYKISAVLQSESDNKRANFVIGVRPEAIISPQDRPEDFDNYWMRARRELDAVDPQFRLIRKDSLCTETRELFILEMRSLGNILVRGWYIRPVKEGVYPAILHVQGYSSFMVPEGMYPGDDMVALGLNIRGHGFSQDHVSPGFPGYILHNVDDKERYIYRGAYMDCIRAVDFLYSRDEVDTTRVAVEGGSQGGALSFATAALDNKRIDLCVPYVPFLSDFRDYFKVAGWPAGEFVTYFEEHPEIHQDEIYKTLSYIDIKNLAPWVKAPVLMSIGLKDVTCPPHINFAAYNQLTVPREYYVYPEAGHGLPGDYHRMKYEWIRKKFNME
ncbi:MAG: acetylxylan esterase [Bacteroidales bacterium]|nr:acetylxylan esterase [Bacteroidales bacterium]